MTPLPLPHEVEEHSRICHEAWKAAQEAKGLERMKLIHKAFPFAVTGPSAGSLNISIDKEHNSLSVSDWGGFITLIPLNDLGVKELLVALGMERGDAGSFRELITGVKREVRAQPKQATPRPKPAKISLDDLDLS